MIEIVGVAMACGFVFGIAVGLKLGTSAKTPQIDALDLTAAVSVPPFTGEPFIKGELLDPKEAREYAVTGSPRHIPWSRRRKELEQEARQKRRQIEQFREIQ